MNRWTLRLILLFTATAVAVQPALHADERRARVVESTLKDLSLRNDAALDSIRDVPRPATDAFDGERVDLQTKPAPTGERLVQDDITSSLHRLRREAVSARTEDGRKARVNESLDRASRAMASAQQNRSMSKDDASGEHPDSATSGPRDR